MSNPASHPFPPLAPQERIVLAGPAQRRFLPQISLPWLEIGLAVMLVMVLRLG
jgi:hypothetical protein